MQKLIIIAGATATGKTEKAIQLAKQINGEIISADSMQVYKYLNIGTAKPTLQEREEIEHHLMDIIDPFASFSVHEYQQLALKSINLIHKKGKTPILVGGTGFYINAVLYKQSFNENESPKVREYYTHLAENQSKEYMHDLLMTLDHVAAKNIDINNTKRVVRALSFIKGTGKLFSDYKLSQEPAFDAKIILLECERNELYKKINTRVDTMLKKGLINEVKSLMDMGLNISCQSMQGIGYKEVYKYLTGEAELDETIDKIKQNTRNYAKRQITWFKHKLPKNNIISLL